MCACSLRVTTCVLVSRWPRVCTGQPMHGNKQVFKHLNKVCSQKFVHAPNYSKKVRYRLIKKHGDCNTISMILLIKCFFCCIKLFGRDYTRFIRLATACRRRSTAANGVVDEPPAAVVPKKFDVVVLLPPVHTDPRLGNSSSNVCTKASFMQMIFLNAD